MNSLLAFLLMFVPIFVVGTSSFQLYDDIRNNNETEANPIFDDINYVGRNLHRVEFSSDYGIEESLVLCHIPMFLRYSNGPDYSIAYAASAGAMLAMHHFNTGDGSVVRELEGINGTCNLRLTTEIVDTKSSPIDAVETMAKLITRSPQSVSEPQPCAVFGSQISSVTSKLGSLNGVFDIFQVSSSAMDTELENPTQYPLLARSHTDVAGFGEMSISYLINNLGISSFALLVPQDSYGLGFQKSVLEAAAKTGMDSIQSQYLPTLTSQLDIDNEIRRALEVFVGHRYNYFIAAFYPELLDTIMGIAGEMGLAGPGKFWMLSGTADTAPYVLSGNFVARKDSSTAKAMAGTGIIVCKGGIPGVGGSYDRFSKKWKGLGENDEDLAYINSKQPKLEGSINAFTKSSDYFLDLPHHIVTFSYDAIVALALSACEAVGTLKDASFTAKKHRDKFAELVFRGASGDFKLREHFPTRTAESSYFVMLNLLPNELNATHISFKGSPLVSYWETNQSTWLQFQNNEFLYSDNSNSPPLELIPEDNEGSALTPPYAIISPIIACIAIAIAIAYGKRRYLQSDSIWNVKIEELQFDYPPLVIGRGTFGLVLLAQYRGTEVAVKRVIPPKSPSGEMVGSDGAVTFDIESGKGSASKIQYFHGFSLHKVVSEKSFKRKSDARGSKSFRIVPESKFSSSSNGRTSNRRTHKTLKKDFIREMRLLSKLRHPCITTVMGAVMDRVSEPMLVMEYMHHGSLHDILHNKTMHLDGEIILPLLQDISQGVRFLHSANPKIIHGDLKASNVLVDSKFRAKVADFGLSQKRTIGATGTPYWMSPELLRGESGNTTKSDVYSFGMILYEVTSRKDPYENEDYDTVIEGIKNPKICKRPTIPPLCPPQIHSLMTDCLANNPENRPNAAEVDERLKRMGDEAEAYDIVPILSLQQKLDLTNRTNDLLFDVFPKHIAEALRDGRKVEPTTRDTVTIFFSDIVGFTSISSSLSAIKVSDMLDRLYSTFDIISRQHDVFKVETIGDAYMAVTNLVKDQPDHTKKIAEFSVDVLKAANKTLIDVYDPSKGYVNLRIGFHSGPVVATVVGSRNPRYCLFGDTVNTASRMESASLTNRIHCSESAALHLKEQHPSMNIVSRGQIEVKGKGSMNTFWVNGSQ